MSSITLLPFASGDTDYIAKMDTNNVTIQTAINSLLAASNGNFNNNLVLLLAAILPGSAVVMGKTSYTYTISGTSLILAGGILWKSVENIFVSSGGATLNFSGKGAATYYIDTNINGILEIVASSTEPIYSVVWTGSAFGTITLVAPVFPSATDTSGTSGLIEDHGITIDGGGSVPTTGSKGYYQFDFACSIIGWSLVGDVSGSAQVTIKKSTDAGFPTTASIIASAPPALSSQQKVTSLTLTGWTTAIGVGDWLEYNLDSITTIKRLTLKVKVQRI
jgi:hypothetical protein